MYTNTIKEPYMIHVVYILKKAEAYYVCREYNYTSLTNSFIGSVLVLVVCMTVYTDLL